MEIKQVVISAIGLDITDPSDKAYLGVGQELFNAFESTGFAYIIDHGLDQEIINNAMESSEKFFRLPQSTKDKHTMNNEKQQGYLAAGTEIFRDTTKEVSRMSDF